MTGVRVNRIGKGDLFTALNEAGIELTPAEQTAFDSYRRASTSMWVGSIDGELVCAYGLIAPTLLSDRAYLWLYTTPALKGNEFLFIRHSQRAVEHMLELHPVITGWSINGTPQSIRWLRWLGVEFLPPQGTAIPFVIRKKHG